MTLKKSIQFALPHSDNAALLGFAETGCYYIEYTRSESSPCLQAGGFKKSEIQDLVDSYNEADGEPAPANLYQHGI